MKKLTFLLPLTITLLFFSACEENIRSDKYNQIIEEDAQTTDVFENSVIDLLNSIDFKNSSAAEYSIDDYTYKYDILATDYSDHRFYKAARATLLIHIIETNKYQQLTNDQLVSLLNDLDEFQTSYPKISYHLLTELSSRDYVDQYKIAEYGLTAYQKSLSKYEYWKEQADTYSSAKEGTINGAWRTSMEDNIMYADKLKAYTTSVD